MAAEQDKKKQKTKNKNMNLREERNFLDLPDSCVTVIKDLSRSSSSRLAVMEALMRLSGGRVRLEEKFGNCNLGFQSIFIFYFVINFSLSVIDVVLSVHKYIYIYTFFFLVG